MSYSFENPLKQMDDNERNIYILSGVFGGAAFVLFVLVSVLFSKIVSLMQRIKDTEAAVEHLMRLNQAPQYGQPGGVPVSAAPGMSRGGPMMPAGGRNPQNVGGGGGNRNQGPTRGGAGGRGGWGQPGPGYQQPQQQQQQGGGSFLSPQQKKFAGKVGGYLRDEAMDFAQDQAMDFVQGQAMDFVQGQGMDFVQGQAMDFVQGQAMEQLGNLAGEDFQQVMDVVPIPNASDLMKRGFPGKKKFGF